MPLKFNKNLKPIKKIKDNDFVWFKFSENQTGLQEICLLDKNTNFIVSSPFANKKRRVASHMAWAGARHSRAPGMSWEILSEMGEKGVDPDKKLETTFITYGHASVADMANIMIHIEEIPMHLAMAIFNDHALNGGQEKSTRYQTKFLKIRIDKDLDKKGINDTTIKSMYKKYFEKSEYLTKKYFNEVEKIFRVIFKPSNKREENSLTARTLDTTRVFMPLGLKTGMSINTSAREWARFIGDLKASPIVEYKQLAEHIQIFLTPPPKIERDLNFKAEAPSLIRHTEPNIIPQQNLLDLEGYLQKKFPKQVKKFKKRVNKKIKIKNQNVYYFSAKNENTYLNILIAQKINILYPYIEIKELVRFTKNINKKQKEEIIKIIFANHNKHKQLPIFDDVGPFTFVLNAAISEVRDMNRHRASRRFIPLPLIYGKKLDYTTSLGIINKGYILPLYLLKIKEMKNLTININKDIKKQFKLINNIIYRVKKLYGENADFSFIYDLMPFCTNVPLIMHQSFRQMHYMPKLRNGVGGQINYRQLAWEMGNIFSKKLNTKNTFTPGNPPNVYSKEEFFGRS